MNNVRVGIYRPTPELGLDDFRQVVGNELHRCLRVMKAFLPLLLASEEAVQSDAPSAPPS